MAEETEMKTQKKVSFTVAECGEFHNMGEFHENVTNAKEAIAILKSIPGERMNGIPTIGIRVADATQQDSYTEIDIATVKYINMDMIKSIPEIVDNKAAQFALAELIHAMPEAEIRGEIPEEIQKKLQIVESREKQAEQLKEITDKLEKGVAEVFTSDKYQELLNTMAKFPNYSLNNTLLIMMQKPDAQLCQSFTGWKEMGRYVKKGEKGIRILAPAPYTIQREQEKKDADGKPLLDADGEPVRESVEVKINAFKVVNTFDISQTDGKELPSIGVNELTGDVERYQTMFEALKQSCPVPIAFEDIMSGAKGNYNKLEKRIALQEGMSEVQTVKTLIHEMAHQKLHDIGNAADSQSRSSKEVEAESVAYTVCQHYGIDTSDYSFSYVAGWSEGKEMKELKASLNTIRRAAAEMIGAIDGKIEELMKDVLTAKDVTKLKGISHEYYSGSREDEYMFSCEVKGEPQTMIYTISRHDDGEGFSIVTDKTNVWEHMSAQELRKLEEIVGQEAELFDWEKRIEGVTAGGIEELKFRFMDNEGSRLTREQSDKVWSAIEKKEKSFQQSKSEKTSGKKQSQKKKESKSSEKPSVKEKLKENKAKTKKPEKKGKEEVACL